MSPPRTVDRARPASSSTPAISASSVDLPTPSGPIDADHDAGGNIERDAVERDDLAVAVGDVLDGDDRSPAVPAGDSADAMTPCERLASLEAARPGRAVTRFCSRAGQTAESFTLT